MECYLELVIGILESAPVPEYQPIRRDLRAPGQGSVQVQTLNVNYRGNAIQQCIDLRWHCCGYLRDNQLFKPLNRFH